MLQSIRDSLTGWVVWFIVGLISIPFVFVGIESFRTGSSDPVVAEVGDVEITQGQFRAAYDQRYQQLRGMLGENFRADLFDTAQFRQSVLDDMTREAVLRQYAEKGGLRASDAAVIDYITTIPTFQVDGRFSSDLYREVLARQGYTPDGFEAQLRNALAIEQLRLGVLESGFVTDEMAEYSFRLAQQQRSLSYIEVPVARYRAEIGAQLEAGAVADRYEETKGQYRAPERVKLAYVVLDREAMALADAPEEDVLKVLYDAEKARFVSPGERKARHILINFGEDKDKARNKAEALKAQLDGGADFDALAKAESDDVGSRDAGGDLGWISRGQMVEGFEEALFALETGEISKPVETEFGFHLIRADDIRPEVTRTLEDAEVREALVTLYQNRERDRRFQAQQEQLEQIAFENPGNLDAVATALSVEIQETDWFTRAGGEGLAAEPQVMTAAFSPEVLQDDENSTPIALADGRLVVIRKAAYEPSRQKPLAEVEDAVRDDLISARAAAKAAEDAADLLASARSRERSLADLAAERGLTVRATGPVQRNQESVPTPVLSVLFRLPRPVDDATPSLGLATLDNGDRAVVALSAVNDPEANPVVLDEQRGQLAELIAGLEFNALQRIMRDEVGVETRLPDELPADGSDAFN
ncbi:SurA N-terminal domain-containing protein [Flagellatimonas centrodinii]|uniref:SurA N-terminal domain-containing protein n=1 Tax=Flagellatimonas centrodinii TaxID=2806210 RepID=UPI001FEDA8E3|nr:SurA N-terminal domain-containing protein [Flagellatimonas centrodinii]ULQ46932.1 SurA N-terminal domain-containing protein [Flagellatimonas centrodinii]